MQRLNAICSFIENSFTFEDKYFDVNEFAYAKELAEQKKFESKSGGKYQLLKRKECADILDYQVAVTIYTAMNETDITEVFGRINSSGKHLSNQERRQAGVTTTFAEVVRKVSMKLRGDDTTKTLHLFDMPQVSVDSKKSNQGYGIQAEDTLWCKQGILTIPDLRNSEDEDIIADITASILLEKPLSRSREKLDDLYDEDTTESRLLENALVVYGSSKLEEDIVKTFSIIEATIDKYSQESKCLLNIVKPENANPIPQAFYTIFMAFFDLIVNQEQLPGDTEKIIDSLKNLQKSLNLSKRYAATKDRTNNINQTKGLIQNYFVKNQDTSALGQGAELIQTLKNSLLRSKIETTKYECKQGLLSLSGDRKLNTNLLQKIIETICGIANSDPKSDGYIFIGIADKESDTKTIKKLDGVDSIEINGRYIVGIDREATVLNKKLEQYVDVLINAIRDSSLTDTLKAQVLMKIDTICYKGLSVIRIHVPPQDNVSFVDQKAFTREHSSTVEANGPKLIAVSKLFQQ
jgi:Putative DNA-binding domain